MTVFSIIMTVLVITLVIMVLRYLFIDPYTLQDMKSAKVQSTISPSTLATNELNVPSSNFAYSVWFYVNDWNYRYGQPKVIFGRMGSSSNANNSSIRGISGRDPCPVVFLGNVENNVTIGLSCFPGVNEQPSTRGGNTVLHTCQINNVPIQKWVNLVISVYGRTLDVYLDGKLVKTCLLPGVAKVNKDADVYVTPQGGFDGWTAKLQYYPNSLNPQEVWDIYSKGYSNYTFSKWFNIYNPYQVQITLLENGTTSGSLTI